MDDKLLALAALNAARSGGGGGGSGDVTALTNRVNNMSTYVTRHENDIAALEETVAANTEQILELQQNSGGSPSGGGGSETVLLVDFTTTEDVSSVNVPSNDTESEFSELFLDIFILSTSQNTAFKPVYVNMAGAQCWAMNASQNVDGRQTRMFGHLDLRTPRAIGYIRCACPVNNGVINTGVTFNTHVWYGSSHDNTCKSINFYTQGNANIMKAGTWVKVWGVKK